MRGDREGEPHVHSAGITLDRGIDERFNLGEVDDLVELPLDFRILHSQNAAVEVDVLTPRQIGVKTGSHLDQGAETAIDPHEARVGTKDARQDLEERALTRTVGTNDAHDFAAAELKVNVLQSPEFTFAHIRLLGPTPDQATYQRRHQVPQRIMDFHAPEFLPQ